MKYDGQNAPKSHQKVTLGTPWQVPGDKLGEGRFIYTKHVPKCFHFASQSLPESHLQGRLEASWALFEASWKAPGGLLDAPEGLLEESGTPLERILSSVVAT